MIQLRPARDDEAPHVIDSWARSFFRFTSSEGRPSVSISPDAWHQIHRAGIKTILEADETCIVVAFHPDVPDEILGWVCWQPATKRRQLYLHYVFVKQPYRRRGFGRTLVQLATRDADHRGFVATHRTWLWHRLSESLFQGGEHARQ